MTDIACVHRGRATLGESPVWEAASGAVWWIDGAAGIILRHVTSAATTESWALGQGIGSIALRATGGLVCAAETGFHLFDPAQGIAMPIACPAIAAEGLPFNDGKCDPEGRFWAGTMDEGTRQGALWRLDPDLTVTRVAGGFAVPNGLNWDQAGRRFLMADSADQTIWAWDCDPDSGRITNRRVLARTEGAAVPDGSAFDAEGHLWSAEWDGWRLSRHAPDGSLSGRIDLPVGRPTSVAFGGADMRTLFITTAAWELDATALAAQPLAGSLLAVRVAVPGLPVPDFAA